MVLFKLLDRSIGLISTVVVARLLVPSDFGVVAMASSVMAAVELLSSFGFDVALIQRQRAGRDQFDTAWTLNLLFAVACAGTLAVAAYPAAQFYSEPRLQGVILALAVGTLVQGFENVGVVAFRKELTFGKEFRFLLIKKLVGFSVTVAMAFALRSYWALVVGMVTGRILGVAISYIAHPYRPRFSLRARPELLQLSKWLLLNNILFFFNHRISDFIIGRLSGAHALGLFTVSYEISNLPSTELVAPINRATLPGYAQLSSDLQRLREAFLGVLGMVATLVLPASIGVAAVADLLVPVIFGEQWSEAVPLIQILAVFGGLHATQTNAGPALMALGKPRALAALASVHLSMLVVLLVILTARYGVLGAAWAVLLAYALTVPLVWVVVANEVGVQVRQMAGVLGRPLIATLIMCAAVLWVKSHLEADIYLTLALSVTCGVLVYFGSLIAIWLLQARPQGSESRMLELTLAYLKDRRRPTF